MFLGIEIGGTKLQLGVGDGVSASLTDLRRCAIDASAGAIGILTQIEHVGRQLCQQYAIERIGFGFGGPVDSLRGIVTKSHQVAGWEAFPLAEWSAAKLGRPSVIGNDCDVAAYAEATHGAGSGRNSVFYVTVGTGVGGGFVCDGRPFGRNRPAIAEIGHLRVGLEGIDPEDTVESLASGWGIAAAARDHAQHAEDDRIAAAAELAMLCGHDLNQLTSRLVVEAAAHGNLIGKEVLTEALRALGWAIAQTVTLLAPEIVVVGGGVSLAGDELFFAPLRRFAKQYAFPPLAHTLEIVPALLGEDVVVHGAVALAANE